MVILTVHVKKSIKALLESSRNHFLIIKQVKIIVGEYTYGLPGLFLGAVGHGMQPIRYRMLKRMDSFNLLWANLWDSVSQNHISKVSLKLL